MPKYLIVTADTNDADYVTKKTLITDEQIERLKPIIKVVKKQKGYNWECLDMVDRRNPCDPKTLYIKTKKLTEEDVEFFDEFIPKGEYGIHTVESMEVIEVSKETKLM